VQRPLWLLDEPTLALDVAAQAMLQNLMRGHLAGGGLIIAATHLPLGLAEARQFEIRPPSGARAPVAWDEAGL
jgi:heme exporter protein A